MCVTRGHYPWNNQMTVIWRSIIHLRITICCIFNILCLRSEAKCWEIILSSENFWCVWSVPPPCPWPKHSLHTHMHSQRQRKWGTKRVREKERVLYKVTILDTFQGFSQSLWRFGKSPCSLIPLLLLWSKGIQWKFHSPKWTPILTLLILLTTARKGAKVPVCLRKNY